MEKIRVLLVDNHELVGNNIRILLKVQQNIKIIGEVIKADKTFETVLKLSPDIVIMDTDMSGLDSLEATRKIKKSNPAVKILILTRYDDDKEYLLSAIGAGISGYMPKKAIARDLITALLTIYNGGSFLYPPAASVLIDFYRHGRTEKY